uniref:Uncharacterized protein n=1 Tax=Macaca fascicularis TaxID=9541 RepID=A0A7N9CPZ5_MACFA
MGGWRRHHRPSLTEPRHGHPNSFTCELRKRPSLYLAAGNYAGSCLWPPC